MTQGAGSPNPTGVTLSPANRVLKADLVVGLERALFGADASAITLQSSGVHERTRTLNHPSPYYLARMAFLQLDSASTDGLNRPFLLAAGVQSHLLDVENAALMSDEELQSLGYAEQDGLRLTLLDLNQRRIRSNFISFEPASDEAGEFKVRSIGGSYADAPFIDDGVAESAYRISDEAGDDPAVQTPHILSFFSLRDWRVTVEVLQNGQPVQVAPHNLAEASAHGNTLSVVNEGLKAAQRSQQYLYAMFKKAVEAPDLTAYLAARQ